MPNYKSLEDIEKEYNRVLSNFNKFKKSFTKEMHLVLDEDTENIANSLKKFKNLLSSWDTSEDTKSVGIEKFINHLQGELGNIIQSHEDLATRANNIKGPSIVQSIKSYLYAAVEGIKKLFTAVAKFVGDLSQKTNATISTGFNNFKESIKNIKIPT